MSSTIDLFGNPHDEAVGTSCYIIPETGASHDDWLRHDHVRHVLRQEREYAGSTPEGHQRPRRNRKGAAFFAATTRLLQPTNPIGPVSPPAKGAARAVRDKYKC